MTNQSNYLCKGKFNAILLKVLKPFNLALLLMALAAVVFTGFVPAPDHYHSPIGRMALRVNGLTTASGQYMGGSGLCVNCHDTHPQGNALVDADGNDVSPVNDWRATIMANSAKDPFWKAKVRHEVLETPSLTNDIENTCTACHAPQGFAEFHMTGQGSHYSMNIMAEDELGLDGVACIACHSIENSGLASSFNGNQPYNENKIAYGTFTEPWASPMISQSGFAPVFGPHVEKSELCAGCHSLFVPTVDFNGNYTGITFFEQATYHEWLNSDFKPEGTECQTCHMPKIDGVKVATQPNWLQPRPFGKHYLVGGNSFMLKLMKENAEVLGISANNEHFDRVIERTEYLLQEQSLTINIQHIETANDTAVFDVLLTNLAGHKFPSGYPSRLLSIEFYVLNAFGEPLFHSGGFSENHEVIGRDEPWEPHHDVIRNENDVQVYEMVFADVEGNVTTVLERAHTLLKDNRLAPRGFTTQHSTYDTVRIAGLAESDPNFNRLNGVEGSGTDRIEYRIATGGYLGDISVGVRAWYQSVPPRWLEEMFSWDDPEINSFKAMYEAADHTPVLVNETLLGSTTGVDNRSPANRLSVYPNPTFTGEITLAGSERFTQPLEYALFGLTGQMVSDFTIMHGNRIALPKAGTYMLLVRTPSGDVRSFKVISLI